MTQLEASWTHVFRGHGKTVNCRGRFEFSQLCQRIHRGRSLFVPQIKRKWFYGRRKSGNSRPMCHLLSSSSDIARAAKCVWILSSGKLMDGNWLPVGHVQACRTQTDRQTDRCCKTEFSNYSLLQFVPAVAEYLVKSIIIDFQIAFQTELVDIANLILHRKFDNWSTISADYLLRRPGRGGHFRYFFIFSLIKNNFFAFFIKLTTYFCTSPIYKAHSQSNKLDKNANK